MNNEIEIKDIIGKAILYRKEGQLDEARDLLIDILVYGEFKEIIYYQLGIIYFKDNNLELAVYAFKKVLYLNPGYSKAGYYLVSVYKKQKNFSQAIKLYKKTWNDEHKKLREDERKGFGIGMWLNKIRGGR